MHHDPALVKSFGAYRCKHIDPKYGKTSMLRRLPFFRDNCNGIFGVDRLPCTAREFQHGAKKLLYDVTITSDLSLLVGHFSLHASVRQQQFAEIAGIVQSRKRTLTPLLKTTDLRIVRPAHNATFPACHPRRPLDLFLCSKEISHVHAEVLTDVHLSDHLPVLLTVTV
jgi:endonuclease/exonuclease/phosphatase family metal-dependent hydrolase